jgi:hypothetical protein
MASHNPKELAGLLRFLGKESADEPPSEVEEAIKTVLRASPGRRYCAGCLAREIGASAHDVRQAWSVVAYEFGFRENFGRCYDCRGTRNRRVLVYLPEE